MNFDGSKRSVSPGRFLFIHQKIKSFYLHFIFFIMAKANKIIILTAPSGAGKTSITRHLIHKFPQLAFSISAATRHARGNEQDGIDYYFISVQDFQKKIKENAFVEWEMVYEGKYYGTLKSELERIWNEGKTPVLDIDVQGAIHVQLQYPENSLSIFIEAPSIEALKNRLQSRSTETAESLQTRLGKAAYEMSFKYHFDVIILNDDLSRACAEADKVVAGFLDSDLNG
jgi:guanylate kinase